MKRLCAIAALGVFGAVLTASERAVVTIRCPLDDTEFRATVELSGFASGQRLDLKKLGAISQPPLLPRCPECTLPIWDKYPDEPLKDRLRAAIRTERYQTEGRSAGTWFALGVLQEEINAESHEIAWTYLRASWEAEDGGQAEVYANAARRAIGCFDRAAAELAKQPERRRDYHLALYLPVELARRTGDFAEARRRLDALPGFTAGDETWLRNAVEAQRALIAAGVATADDQLPQLPAPSVRP